MCGVRLAVSGGGGLGLGWLPFPLIPMTGTPMLALALALLQSPDTVRYAIAFPDRVHHEAAVTA